MLLRLNQFNSHVGWLNHYFVTFIGGKIIIIDANAPVDGYQSCRYFQAPGRRVRSNGCDGLRILTVLQLGTRDSAVQQAMNGRCWL